MGERVQVRTGPQGIRDVRQVRGIEPYHQGAFDGLCGLYASINAMRLVTSGAIADDTTWAEIFGLLIRKTDEQIGLAEAVLGGITAKSLRSVVKDAIPELCSDFGISLALHRPFPAFATTPWLRVKDRLHWHLQQSGTAVIAILGADVRHWTVLLDIDDDRLHVFDSIGMRCINLAGNIDAARVDPASAIVIERQQ